jgi:hypothetical protein
MDEQHQAIRDSLRRGGGSSPRLGELEHGDTPPYDVLRKMMQTFGIDELARQRFGSQIKREKVVAAGEKQAGKPRERTAGGHRHALIPIIELCRYCPGMVTTLV